MAYLPVSLQRIWLINELALFQSRDDSLTLPGIGYNFRAIRGCSPRYLLFSFFDTLQSRDGSEVELKLLSSKGYSFLYTFIYLESIVLNIVILNLQSLGIPLADECGARSYNVTPETGLAVVEVPGSAGKTALSLPPGTYQVHRRLTNTNCTFQYQVNGKYEDLLNLC